MSDLLDLLDRIANDQGFTLLEVRQARAALAARLPDREWQPISTAPKDKRVLLGWEDGFGEWDGAVDFAHCTRGGWLHGRATHWQPFPARPTPAESTP